MRPTLVNDLGSAAVLKELRLHALELQHQTNLILNESPWRALCVCATVALALTGPEDQPEWVATVERGSLAADYSGLAEYLYPFLPEARGMKINIVVG